jgi:hypothetical protein
MTTSRRILAALAVATLGACSLGAIRSHHHQKARQEVLGVLSGQFETVFAADAGLAEGVETPHDVPHDVARALSAPFAVVRYGIGSLGAPYASRIWHDTSWVLIGATDFQLPPGESSGGDVRSRSTAVFLLKHSGALMSFAGGLSPVLKRTSDGTAWTWTSPPSEGHPTPFAFVAMEIRGPYLVVSDNQHDCQMVTAELAETNLTPPAPEGLDAAAFAKSRLFGYRRYKHGDANHDSAGLSVISEDATGLEFSFDGKAPRAELDLVGRNSQTADRINGARLLPALRMSSPGRWTTTIRLDRDSDSLEEMFAVLSLFGFGVYA